MPVAEPGHFRQSYHNQCHLLGSPSAADLPAYADARRQEKELLTQWLTAAQGTAGRAG